MKELDRNKRIEKEFKRISVFFKDLKENEKSIILPLIQNAAFMRITLEDLQQIIAEQGPVEAYQNGANQYGMKQSAALQSYNAMVKNFAAVLKTLFSWLPAMYRPKDPLTIFLPDREEDLEAEQRQQEEEKRREDEIQRAIEYQKKQRELDSMIAKAETQEERNRLVAERNSLTWN